MRRRGHVTPVLAVVFVESIVFLALVRRGAGIPLSAGIACVFAVIAHLGRLVLREETRQNIPWTQVLHVQQWSLENRRDLLRGALAALCFALIMVVSAYFTEKI